MGRGGPALRLQDPFSCPSFSLDGSYSPTSIRGIAVTDLIAKGAVQPAPSTPGFYSR